MKKLPALSMDKILLVSGFTLALTLAGFWHHSQNNAMATNLMNLQQGVGTCFSRVNQTFTAAMIRDTRSPYLNRDFMSLSDECLRESAKTAAVDFAGQPKMARLHNELVSEAYWFHEKVTKLMGASPLNKEVTPLTALTEKYAKVEGLRMDLADQLDLAVSAVRSVQTRDLGLMGFAFLFFMISLSVMGWQGLKLARGRREIERQALSLLNTANANVGGMVDQLVTRALRLQGLNVTTQVFRDYHAEVLESMSLSGTAVRHREVDTAAIAVVSETEAATQVVPATTTETDSEDVVPMRHMLTTIALRMRVPMDAQDGSAVADADALAQILQAMGQRFAGWEARIVGSREEKNYLVRLQGTGVCLNSSELEYAARSNASMEGVDLNVVQAVDMAREEGIVVHARNRLGEDGTIEGAEMVLELPLTVNRGLVGLVRGKKRDLTLRLTEAQRNSDVVN
jgi:hypothetical protein